MARRKHVEGTMPRQEPAEYATTFCNRAHRTRDGKPVAHNCFILPPAALRLERDGDIPGAIAAIDAAKPLREMARGVRPAKPKIVNVTCATAEGYRWLLRNVAGVAITHPDGFEVTNAERWAELLSAAGGKEHA